ncbi:MAG TPA: isocitrate lyase/PEP mutase family protein, partial [Candidatus Limnocylindria bacterium]|nr:isocitrate lyase/PEP mutase family protein [Candidatus Limnocylindria bacterium]
MKTKSTTRLKELLAGSQLLVMSGGFSPLHARMSEITGYEAFFMSGSQVAAYVYGYPDVGLLGLNEMVEAVRRITNVTDIPVFADADTGYGNAVNVYYTVQAYIRAGAAGLHIEDQEAPKKSGTLAGRRLISVEEAVGKYRAAVAAKQELDADFVVCARC